MHGGLDGSSDGPAIVGSGLGHSFGQQWLFRNLSFRLVAGEAVAVCGPSGCGKTTLLSILARWLAPSEGELARYGVARVSWVFQNPHGVARRSAVDHVVYPLLARGLSVEEAERGASDLMEQFSIGKVADHPFSALSGGEAQRLMLARAVAASPDVLLVDEPTAQLDRSSARTVNQTMGKIAGSGSIVVVATHDQDTMTACDRIIDLQAER
ncbi:MAG: ATP-binding cassette domain-containing protein [Micrococcales bacterium]|nr:ATP-binding cassette domain-containing protein [Micrococcales bacterium]